MKSASANGLSPDKIELFENAPVARAVCRLAIPSVISQLIAMVYNLADTYFVGRLNDPNQVAAVSLCFPAAMMITALTNFFGIGGGSFFSRCLGTREYGKARSVSSFCLYCSAAIAVAYSALIWFVMEPLLKMLGASPATVGYCRQYMTWVVVIGGLPSLLNMLLGHMVRAEGASRHASIGMSLGGILNIILDPLFILPSGLGLELRGAAMATCISNCAAVIYFLVYLFLNRRKTVICISPSAFAARGGIASGVARVGLPAFAQTLMPIVSNIILNNMAVAYDDCAVAAIGIVKKVDIFAMNVTNGMSQGVIPLMAYSYSSGRYDRFRLTRRFTLICSIAFCLICVCVFELYPEGAVSLFIKDLKTVSYGAVFLRVQCVSTPFMAVNFMTISAFQAAGQTKQSLAMTLVRKGLLDIPLYFLFDWLMPLTGLMLVQTVLDASASVLAVFLFSRFMRSLRAAGEG